MRTIPTWRVGELNEHIERLNKRAAKLGVEGLTVTISEPYLRTVETTDSVGNPRTYTEHAVDFEIKGSEIKLAGYTFVAAIDHFEGLVRTSPHAGEIEVQKFANEGNCDHCGHDRDRSKTYIVQDEDGNLTQVGSTCVKDFLGHDISLRSLDFAFSGEDEEGEFFTSGSGDSRRSLVPFLATTNAVIVEDGWVPRSYGEFATADTVCQLVWGSPIKGQKEYPTTDEDFAFAEKALAWAREVKGNDYLFNLSQIANNGFVTPKSAGLAASIISAYRRHIEKEIERRIEREESSPVPITDERIQITGTIVNVTWKDGYTYYSDSVKKITVRDDRGFKVWGTCPKKVIDAEQGDRVTFTALITRGDRDESFGFFKSPQKPAMINEKGNA